MGGSILMLLSNQSIVPFQYKKEEITNITIFDDLPQLTQEEIKYIEKNKKELKKTRKARLKKYMTKITKKTRRSNNNLKKKKAKKDKEFTGVLDTGSIRTEYEKIFESYLKLLGQPYIIDSIFCFTCNNYYYYGNHSSLPKKCRICLADFNTNKEKKGCVARPDFILDFNNPEAREQYAADTHRYPEGLENIKLYRDEYMKKVGMIRIDGSAHLTRTQMFKDFYQVRNFKDAGVKVFIVTNDDIDFLLQDNGIGLLNHCHMIGDCILDEVMYTVYSNNLDFRERIKKPIL